MKLLPAILIMLVISSFCSAQEVFMEGYVVRSKGDTLHGFIQEDVQKDLLHTIKFKSDNKVRGFNLLDCSKVQSFGYTDGTLYRAVDFINAAGDSAIDERCFAKLLVKGFYDLYSFIEDERTYFVITIDSSSYFIFNSVFTSNGELRKEGNYISRLDQFAAECDRNDLNAERISYSEKDIAGFVTGLDTCLAPGIIPVNYYHKPRTKIEIMIFAGSLPLGQQSQFTGEAFLRLTYPQLSRKSSINIGIHYSNTLSVTHDLNLYNFVEKISTRNIVFSIPATLQYNFTTGIIQSYIYAGFSGAILNQTTNQVNITPSGFQRKFGIAFIAGLGIEGRLIKRLYIRADWRYELILQFPSIGLAYKFK